MENKGEKCTFVVESSHGVTGFRIGASFLRLIIEQLDLAEMLVTYIKLSEDRANDRRLVIIKFQPPSEIPPLARTVEVKLKISKASIIASWIPKEVGLEIVDGIIVSLTSPDGEVAGVVEAIRLVIAKLAESEDYDAKVKQRNAARLRELAINLQKKTADIV